jgi:penicillin amidase
MPTRDFTFSRDDNGIPHIRGVDLAGMYRGQGYAHATDRGLQILMMRILGRGQLSETLDASDESLAIDIFFRRMNWSGHTADVTAKVEPDTMVLLDAYCDGINQGFKDKYPWELKLASYREKSWVAEDVILLSRMLGYLTLAQSQAEIERLFVEMVQADVSRDQLEELFPGLLGGLDIDLLKSVKLEDRIVTNPSLWGLAAPRAMASNNWVVSGSKTASGRAMLANDPHLEVNRLPNVWCEMVLQCGDRWMMGGTMPGLPSVLSGRNPDLAWGATYAFVDSIDSWVEKCENGKYYRKDNDNDVWLEFERREEIIQRKKKPPVTHVFYENELGTLEGDPFAEEYCLVSRWAAADIGTMSLQAIFDLWGAASVKQGMARYGKIETGWSYVFADNSGDIGFQMSGKVPKRREGVSGLVPLPAWNPENHWQGFHSVEEMPRIFNPPQGYFCTANNDLNQWGVVSPINMSMGSYRADRIATMLEKSSQLTVEDMSAMHFDVYSLQAEQFLAYFKPLLPDTDNGRILQDWDYRYDSESKGAYLFEAIYRALILEVFGVGGMGEKAVAFLLDEAGVFIDFYANFDYVMLSPDSDWFAGRNRDEVFAKAIHNGLSGSAKRWKDVQQFTMRHIMFGGKLPSFFGFDRGPVTAVGGRATIHQGQLYRAGGRQTSFLPSFRWITDFSESSLHSNLAGGPSDRRFSRYYFSDMKNWLAGEYKVLKPFREPAFQIPGLTG